MRKVSPGAQARVVMAVTIKAQCSPLAVFPEDVTTNSSSHPQKREEETTAIALMRSR
jgi:hypothetical protein